MRGVTLTALAAIAALSVSGAALAQKLPDQLTWTAYDVGSGGYNQAVAIGNALKNKMGVTLRVLPGKNDVSRTVPLRRSEERRVGEEWVRKCRSRWSPDH